MCNALTRPRPVSRFASRLSFVNRKLETSDPEVGKYLVRKSVDFCNESPIFVFFFYFPNLKAAKISHQVLCKSADGSRTSHCVTHEIERIFSISFYFVSVFN